MTYILWLIWIHFKSSIKNTSALQGDKILYSNHKKVRSSPFPPWAWVFNALMVILATVCCKYFCSITSSTLHASIIISNIEFVQTYGRSTTNHQPRVCNRAKCVYIRGANLKQVSWRYSRTRRINGARWEYPLRVFKTQTNTNPDYNHWIL